jgi:hypothetical protein
LLAKRPFLASTCAAATGAERIGGGQEIVVAAVLVALWLCVFMPVLLVELLGRRRSSIATFEATLRGLDRSTAAAVTLVAPSVGTYARGAARTTADATAVRARRLAQTRERRQHAVLGVGLIVVVGTLVGVVASFSRSTLALHALADQCVVAYATGCVWTDARRSR